MTSSAGAGDELTRLITTLVRDVPDYPQAGVVFKDITPLLADGKAFAAVIEALAETYGPVDKVAGIEARGFIFAAPVACRLGLSRILLRVHPGSISSFRAGRGHLTGHSRSSHLPSHQSTWTT